MARLWGGRFAAGMDEVAKAYSFSIAIDQRLYAYDIALNRAYATAIAQAGVLTPDECRALHGALDEVKEALDHDLTGHIQDDEDVHSLIERLVVEKTGPLGKKMHTGKSRNDQVATDMRLWVMDTCQVSIDLMTDLIRQLMTLATEHQGQLFPGFTHFQPAQPMLLAHHFLAYVAMIERDIERAKAVHAMADVCPLGSGALVGSGFPIDRMALAQDLGFSRITQNSVDAVSDRDFVLDLLAMSSTCMMHLSRLCEELILWSSPLLGLVVIGDGFTTGSSLMPQKKNPDMAELMRGRASKVQAMWVALIALMKGLPLAYNRDLQEDKSLAFEAVDILQSSLACMTAMLGTLVFQPAAIEVHLQRGQLLATELADLLVKRGVPFRDAHEQTGHLVAMADRNGVALPALSVTEAQRVCPLFDETLCKGLTMTAAVASKTVVGGTSPDRISEQLHALRAQYGGC